MTRKLSLILLLSIPFLFLLGCDDDSPLDVPLNICLFAGNDKETPEVPQLLNIDRIINCLELYNYKVPFADIIIEP